MTHPSGTERDARRELRDDRRIERRLVWKGIFALLVAAAVGWLRQRYWM
jgi:hypothetical protein